MWFVLKEKECRISNHDRHVLKESRKRKIMWSNWSLDRTRFYGNVRRFFYVYLNKINLFITIQLEILQKFKEKK